MTYPYISILMLSLGSPGQGHSLSPGEVHRGRGRDSQRQRHPPEQAGALSDHQRRREHGPGHQDVQQGRGLPCGLHPDQLHPPPASLRSVGSRPGHPPQNRLVSLCVERTMLNTNPCSPWHPPHVVLINCALIGLIVFSFYAFASA